MLSGSLCTKLQHNPHAEDIHPLEQQQNGTKIGQIKKMKLWVQKIWLKNHLENRKSR